MSDTMLFGVLRMPFDLAMSSEISRLQFYNRAQQAADEVERLRAALEAAESRANFFLAQCRDAQDALKPYAEACLKMQETFSKLDATNNADRGHVPKPAPWPPAPLPNAKLTGAARH